MDRSDHYESLELPATDFELLDVRDRMKVETDQDLRAEIYNCNRFEFLMRREKPYPLYELNELAKKLADLDDCQQAAFQGLVKMDQEKGEQITTKRLIDLACSTESCHVVWNVEDDEQLGRFYVENGFYPELDNIPEAVYEMLDYERLGRQARTEEGGVYTDSGYVVQEGEIKEVSNQLTFQPKWPDYIFKLVMSTGVESTVSAELPMERDDLQRLLRSCTQPLRVCKYDGFLRDVNFQEGAPEEVVAMNELAMKIQGMESKHQMLKLKGIQEAIGAADPKTLLALVDSLEEYILEPEIKSAEDLGISDLRNTLGDTEFERLRPFVNLAGYGRETMAYWKVSLTPYGAVQREDGEPIFKKTGMDQWRGDEMMYM